MAVTAETKEQEPSKEDNKVEDGSAENHVPSEEPKQTNLAEGQSLWKQITAMVMRQRSPSQNSGTPDENKLPPFITEKVMDQEDGYPRLAQFLSTSDNVLICRKFGWLHSRLLLYKQDELAQLERDLHELDSKDDEGEGSWRLYSRKYDDSRTEAPRKMLIAEIDKKLREYDELVDRIERASHRKPPSDRNLNTLLAWIWNEKPVVNEEFEFIFRKDDLIAVKEDADETWLDDTVTLFLNKIPGRIIERLFATKVDRSKPGNDNVKIFSPTRVDNFVRIIIALVAMVMMTVPVVLLCTIASLSVASQIGIVFSWIAVFAVAVAVLTPARRFEVVAATAAYSAVLVVFLGNLQKAANSDNS